MSIYSEIANEINYVNTWIATNTANKMRKKLARVYDKLIDDFYSYQPTAYRRHDVKAFTPAGANLYRALQEGEYDFNRIRPATGVIDGSITLDASDMVDYNYRYDSKEAVLDCVLNGVRFPSGKYETHGEPNVGMEFKTDYSDSECSASGTILDILNSIRDQLGEEYFSQSISEARKTIKCKYVTF